MDILCEDIRDPSSQEASSREHSHSSIKFEAETTAVEIPPPQDRQRKKKKKINLLTEWFLHITKRKLGGGYTIETDKLSLKSKGYTGQPQYYSYVQ